MKHSILLLTFLISCLPASAQRLIEIGEGYSSTSINTTVFRNSSLVTFKQHQYTAYYDAEGYMVIGKRKLKSKQWELQRSQYKGNVADAHNVISLMVEPIRSSIAFPTETCSLPTVREYPVEETSYLTVMT